LCNCPDSPWVQRAQTYLAANQNHQNGKWHTVNFLLQGNHCGLNKRVTIKKILQYLSYNGISLNREQFQQTILGELKRKGIVATLVYPGRQGGVFIPCIESEVKEFADQVFDRVDSEIVNLAGISQQTSFSNLVSLLAQIISWIRRNI
jgi:hypothetical protein